MLESLLNKAAGLKAPIKKIKGDSNTDVFLTNLQNFWNTFFTKHLRWLLLEMAKAVPNQSNISYNIMFLPCWMKCWNGLRNYKIYKVLKKKKKIILDDVG